MIFKKKIKLVIWIGQNVYKKKEAGQGVLSHCSICKFIQYLSGACQGIKEKRALM